MSMTIEQMRLEVTKLYSGVWWRERVANMPDKQVFAIYQQKILNGGKRGGDNAR